MYFFVPAIINLNFIIHTNQLFTSYWHIGCAAEISVTDSPTHLQVPPPGIFWLSELSLEGVLFFPGLAAGPTYHPRVSDHYLETPLFRLTVVARGSRVIMIGVRNAGSCSSGLGPQHLGLRMKGDLGVAEFVKSVLSTISGLSR